MDLGARRLGLDPAEIRRRNFVRPAEMPYRPGLTYKDGVPVTYDPGDFPPPSTRLALLLRRMAAAAKVARPAARQSASVWRATRRDRARPVRGRDGARGPERQGLRLHRRDGAGAGPRDHARPDRRRRARRRLGNVQVSAGDTALFPFGMGTGGSRVAANSGPAVAQTARESRARRAGRRRLLECAPEDDAHRAESRPRGRDARARGEPRTRRACRGKVEGAQGDRRARPPRVHLLPSRTVTGRSARRPPQSRWTWRRARSACSRAIVPRSRSARSSDRRGPAPRRRRRAGGLAEGASRRRGRPRGGDLMDYAIPRPISFRRWRWRSTSIPR